ncbi:MAG: hypothetical protein H6510_06575 [Acidobacteria bacterium]|nr:hypothetical protein [Acidobacteriota bacterium]MCB9397459.1 hypothetical protein [Acidobacteriota bacterium]
MIVIIPSNRWVQLDYLQPLIESGARFLVVDDSEGSIRIDHPQFEVFNWSDRKKHLGKLDDGFPRRNGACRNFGFYLAWHRAEPNEIIIALDDDCKIETPDFAQKVECVLTQPATIQVETNVLHWNILDCYADIEDNVFPRGFPYSHRGLVTPSQFRTFHGKPAKFCLGLWQEVFDINAIDKIQGPNYRYPNSKLKYPSVAVPPGTLISVCSMNMQFRSELIPAVFQFPMNFEVMPGWVIDRYGDIWGGFVLKTLMDRMGDGLVVGEPIIRHLKEGNFQRNMWQEHICHLVNDEFIHLLLEGAQQLQSWTYLSMLAELGEFWKSRTERASALLKPYLRHLTYAIDCWVQALDGACRKDGF